MTEEMMDKILGWIEENYPDGVEIYVDYSDEMGEKTASKIVESSDPMMELFDWLYESYDEASWEAVNCAFNEMLGEMGIEENDELLDFFRDNCHACFPEEHFLNQEFCVNIEIDTGDWKNDFSPNVIYPHYGGSVENGIDKNSALAWLAEKQGYNRRLLQSYLYNHNGTDYNNEVGFLQSVYQELANCSSCINKLVILKKMSLRELMEWKKNPVRVDKSCTCGLFDSWNGGGSLLDIELEKDFDIPVENIHDIVIDEATRYNIHEVYGVSDMLWE